MASSSGDAGRASLPDLTTTSPLSELVGGVPSVRITIPDAYLVDSRLEAPGAEGLAIQRLLTLAQRNVKLTFAWEPAAARRILESPAVHPLAALSLCLSQADHELPKDPTIDMRRAVEAARTRLLAHRLGTDMFSDRQMLLCIDHHRPSLPPDLYDVPRKRLRSDEEFESLVDDLLSSQKTQGLDQGFVSKCRLPLAVILRELIENTDDHAKTGADGNILKPNALRGVLVKRILQARQLPTNEARKDDSLLPCLEFTIFDAGIGYYDSYRRQLLRGQARGEPVTVGEKQGDVIRRHPLSSEVPLETEHAILLKCLERHSEQAIPDPRPGHRGLGLYEVLRALKMMSGLFEVRTGRIHGYRSFLRGEHRIQLEPDSSKSRPGMPKPSLLDVSRRNVPRPTAHEQVCGSVVRVVIPLE